MPCVRGIVDRGIICIHNNYIYVYTTVISYIVLVQHRSAVKPNNYTNSLSLCLIPKYI